MNTPLDVHSKRGLAFTPDDSVEITVATNAGACFGVVRAIKLGHQAIDRSRDAGTPLYSLGPLIHNPHVVREFNEKGVRIVDDADQVVSGTVVLRSHGVPQPLEATLREKGIGLVDATCPLVKKPQRIAKSLGDKGYYLVMVGDPKHPEVKGVLSYFGRPDFLITYSPDDLAKIPDSIERVGVLAQTTIEKKVFDAIVERARGRFGEVAVYNTICDATSVRQREAHALAEHADVVVVVGGKNSSNTTKLVKICEGFGTITHHIESLEEIQPEWFQDKRQLGVTGGASTPHEFVDEAGDRIAAILRRN
jgi:4-hydroxy-3-methylbut-2-enyl diphosphate reductase